MCRAATLALLFLASSAWAAPPQACAQTEARVAFLRGGSLAPPPPTLGLGGRPAPGQPFSLVVAGGPAGAAGTLFLGFATTSLLLPTFGAEVVLAAPVRVQAFLLDPAGRAEALAALNAVPGGLCGLQVAFQAVVVDPQSPGGLAFTRGVQVEVGRIDELATFRAPLHSSGPFGVRNAFPAAVVAHVDGDGLLDVVVRATGGTAAPFHVVRARAEGGFHPPVEPFAGAPTTELADLRVADFDGDGNADVVGHVPSSTFGASRLRIFRGLGDGTFAAPVAEVVLSFAVRTFDAGDLDADGFDDLLVHDTFGETLAFRGSAGGLLPVAQPVAIGGGGMAGGLRLADLDADGALDVVYHDHWTDRLVVATGDGLGAFGPPISMGPPATYPYHKTAIVEIADLDGNGALDLAVGLGSVLHSPSTLRTYLGAGDGSFVHVQEESLPGRPQRRAMDWTGDGIPDLLSFESEADRTLVLVGSGDGTFAPGPFVEQHGTLVDGAVADVDGDGVAEFLGVYEDALGVVDDLQGVAPPTFGDGFAIQGHTAVALGDLDHDGFLDLARHVSEDDTTWIHLGDGSGGFDRVGTPFASGVGDLRWIALHDADGDGRLDLLAVDHQLDRVVARLGLVGGGFGPAVHAALSSDPKDARLGDVDGDGLLDLVTVHRTGTRVQVSFGASDGTFQPAPYLQLLRIPIQVEVVDADRDGLGDFVVLFEDGELGLYLGDGVGGALSSQLVDLGTGTAGASPLSFALGDLDGDGWLDAVCSNDGVHQGRVVHGLPGGAFSSAPTVLELPPSHFVRVLDVTGDGDADVVCVGPGSSYGAGSTVPAPLPDVFTSQGLVLSGNGDGTFRAPLRFLRPRTHVWSFAAGDLDLDGSTDLVFGGRAVDLADVHLNHSLRRP